MADMFRCDHCGRILDKTEKKGQLRLEEIPWNDGKQFPSRLMHLHDLCGRCLAKLNQMVDSAIRSLPKGEGS